VPELADLIRLLTDADYKTIKYLCYDGGMRGMPRLVRLQYGSRAAGLRNREIAGPNCRRIEYARWQFERGGWPEW